METAVVIEAAPLTQTQTFAGLAGDDEGSSDHRPPLLLLHGLTFDRSMWQPMLAHLRQTDPGRRVLSLDLPGHGESTGNWCYDGEAVGVAVHQAVLAAGLRFACGGRALLLRDSGHVLRRPLPDAGGRQRRPAPAGRPVRNDVDLDGR